MVENHAPIGHGGGTMDALEIALLAAVEHCTEPLVLSNPRLPDAPLVAVNPAFCLMSGYSASEILGRNCRFLQGPGTEPASPRRIAASVAAQEGCIEWIVNYRKDGSAFWNLLFITPIFDAAGALQFFLGNQLDITKGFPDWLGEVTFGRARMSAEVQAEFSAALQDILRTSKDPARGLEQTIAHARRIAELSTDLEPGAPPPGVPPLPAWVSAAAPT